MASDRPSRGRRTAGDRAAAADRLAGELRELGRTALRATPDPEVVASAVLTRLTAEPEPEPAADGGRRAQPRRRKAVVAALAGLLLALTVTLTTTPVGAAVADWFGIGGVAVEQGPRVPSASASPPPTAASGLTLAQARALVGFAPLVPSELGPPDGIEVSADRRVLSMTWGSGPDTVRLDQFADRLSPYFLKKVHGSFEATTVDGAPAAWFPEPHEVAVLDEQGRERVESARLAGRTLVWERDGTTLRLEGELTRDRAVEIAGSARNP